MTGSRILQVTIFLFNTLVYKSFYFLILSTHSDNDNEYQLRIVIININDNHH